VILIDANLLIYAVDRDSPHHAKARRWLESILSEDTSVGLPWLVILAFIRVTTRHGILRHPLAIAEALTYVDGWLAQPYVAVVVPSEKHWPILRNLLEANGAAGNVTSDAHLAALALENGSIIASADNDFQRFSGVRHLNPLLL
jgi:toxin-antitoxin system PIN domain toxin